MYNTMQICSYMYSLYREVYIYMLTPTPSEGKVYLVRMRITGTGDIPKVKGRQYCTPESRCMCDYIVLQYWLEWSFSWVKVE